MTEETKSEVVENVLIERDGDVTHFTPIEEPKKEEEEKDTRGFWRKILDWFKTSKVTPYVKARDLADPFGDRTDPDAGSDGAMGIEAGIKIRF